MGESRRCAADIGVIKMALGAKRGCEQLHVMRRQIDPQVLIRSPVEVREHAQALIYELLASKRFALAIEQNRIAFDLGQRKVRFVRLDEELQQLRYDMGGVIDLRGAREFGKPTDIGDQDDRLFSHGKDLLRRAASSTYHSDCCGKLHSTDLRLM
jgi:hypothetical protein